MFSPTFQTKLFNISDFCKQYQDVETYLKYCAACENYDNRWSCPPTSFNPIEFLKDYNDIVLIAAKIKYTDKAHNVAIDADSSKSYSMRILKKAQKEISAQLLDIEKEFPKVKSFASGACPLCCKCTRPDNKPCKKPEQMRYSLDAFGLDLTKICQDEFKLPLKWSKDSLPEYHVLVSAIVIPNDIDEGKVLESVKNIILKPFELAPLTGKKH